MSPEQINGSTVDARCDQYALGCILYEMLTGQVPFDDPTGIKAVLRQHVEAPVPPPRQRCPEAGISAGVEAIVLRMLAKDRDERFPSSSEVAAALGGELLGLQSGDNLPPVKLAAPVELPSPSPPPSPTPGRARRDGRLLLLSVAIAVCVAVLGWFGSRRWGPGRRDPGVSVTPEMVADLRQRAMTILGEQLSADERALRLGALGALGRTEDLAARALIEPLLQDPDATIQAQAAAALGQLGDRRSLPVLLAALDRSTSARSRAALADALDQLDDPQGERVLTQMLEGVDDEARFRAAYVLLRKANPHAIAILLDLLQRAHPPQDLVLDTLARLSQAGQPEALQQLVQRFRTAGDVPRQLPIAFRLAQLGDENGLKFLRELAHYPGPEQLLAARLLCSVEHPDLAALFRRILGDARATPAALGTAAEGIGLAGQLTDLLLLRSRLLPVAPPPPALLRQQAAAAVLQLLNNEPSLMNEHSWRWARSAISDSSWSVRESAAAVLGDLPRDQATALLGELLQDPDARVRRRATHSLGTRSGRPALLALRAAIHDPDRDVRQEALASLLRVGQELQQHGVTGLWTELAGWLSDIVASGSPAEQLQARSVLGKLGDPSQASVLAGFLSAPDRGLRRLLFENYSGAPGPLLEALSDEDPEVRWLAARHLAKAGDPRAVPVLQATLARGGVPAIRAFGLLRQLGQPAAVPPDLANHLSRAEVTERLLIVESLGTLPPELAVLLLGKAARDPERLVRRLAAEVAADLPAGPQGPQGLPVLRLLQHDPDAGVRFRVQGLMARMGDVSLTAGAAPRPETTADARAPRPVATPDSHPALPGATTDSHPALPIATAATPRPAPEASTSAASRATPAGLPAAGAGAPSASPQAQFLLIENTAQAGLSAFEHHEYSRALRLLAKATADCQQQRSLAPQCAPLAADLYVRIAQIYEKQGHGVEAAGEYESALSAPPGKRARPELQAAAEQGLARLKLQLGRITVPKRDRSGKCREVTQWTSPGKQIISRDGQSQVVKVRAGEKVSLGVCR